MLKLILSMSITCLLTVGMAQTKKQSTAKIDTTNVNKTDTLKSKKAEPKKNTRIKPYAEVVTAEAISQKGLLAVHQIGDKWLLEIPDSVLNKDMLVVTRFTKVASGANAYGGEAINQMVVKFEKGPKDAIFLRAIATIAVADSTDKIAKAVELSHANPLLATFPILAEGTNSVVVDGGYFFYSDNILTGINNAGKRRFSLTALLGDRSYIESVRTFPTNLEVRTVKTYAALKNPSPAPSFISGNFDVADAIGAVTLSINTSFVLLPEKLAKRRFYDARVGYFANGYAKFSDNQQKVKKEAFIVRWRLEPKPEDVEKWQKGELVEPIKPIVFYIDPATPKKWVPYLIAGVNDWNEAFEHAGFKNAIQGKEWPENDSTMSLEDARFSVIRYFASTTENAYGPNVHDPRTGEIIESHIGWYHNVMSLLHKWYFIQVAPNDKRAQKMEYDEQLMGELIRFVCAHEVGHTLGLRHNFGSSSTVPVEKLRDKKWVEANGHTPSIMDYARFNYVAQPEDNIGYPGLFPRIGDYDKWAIRWGYGYIGGENEYEEKKISNKLIIDNLRKNPRLWFGTETDSADPRSQAECIGDDNMKASEYGIKNLKRIVANLEKWTKEEADQYNNLRSMMSEVYNQYIRYIGHVIKNVGGVETSPKSIEEEGDVYEPTPREQQKRAVAFLQKHLFSTPHWLLEGKILNKISSPSFGKDYLEVRQQMALASLLSVNRFNRMMASEGRFANKYPYTLAEMLKDVESGIFASLNSKADFYKRGLQRQYVKSLIEALEYYNTKDPSDAAAIVLYRLTALRRTLNAAAPTDALTKYHLINLSNQIKQALEPVRVTATK